MPARQKPVSVRHSSNCRNEPALHAPAKVQAAPASAHSRNTRRALKRSAMASSANTSVPAMKPNCTAEVSVPTSAAGQP